MSTKSITARPSSFCISKSMKEHTMFYHITRALVATMILFAMLAAATKPAAAAPAGPDDSRPSTTCLPSLDTQLAALPHGTTLFNKNNLLDTVKLNGITIQTEDFEDAAPNGAFVFNTNSAAEDLKDESDDDKLVGFGKGIAAFRSKAGNVYDEGAKFIITFDQPHRLDAILFGDWDHRHEMSIDVTLDDGTYKAGTISIPVEYDSSNKVVRSVDMGGIMVTRIAFGLSESLVFRLVESCTEGQTFKITTSGRTPHNGTSTNDTPDSPIIPASLPKTSLPDGEKGCAITATDAKDLPWCEGFAPATVVLVAVSYNPAADFAIAFVIGLIAAGFVFILTLIIVFYIRPRRMANYR